MNRKKIRLDVHLAETGLSQSRERAKKEILAGWVRVNGETVREPSRTVYDDVVVTVERPGGLYVSRGGEKLARALEEFHIDVKERVVVDLGASTGGFTDCLLKAGARRVFAVDVGYGQLDYSLRHDSRVFVMERTHVKSLTPGVFDERPDFFTADLSFISIVKVIPVVKDVLAPIEGIILVKPQFEAEPGEHKKGVVRKEDIHERILIRVLLSLASLGADIRGLCHSPIKGPAGNIEFLLHVFIDGNAPLAEGDDMRLTVLVHEAVTRAHGDLNPAP
ncbi:MAG: TlyA family rRNA (cytidine-2'-O)-methyltransferase [Spirochaetae bacterium HGW-Spirochaetae-1]|jgi:23S rRNA (cytidine1920-2'-O)/16S rRNA (cytidine1409-2'-O)-methyltransferase|nr:MAG: TlyA family rRNA (cytidine-2'-O)-methyltransferase [Spirochaetae bacterium HGW-Spirochaetae-1]